jgi:TolB protein
MGEDANVDVYVVQANGRGKRRLTRHPAVEGNPAWSPDGRTIAFTRRGAGFQIHTYVMNADGSGKRRLTHNGGIHFSVAWSPDGQKLLFERPNPRHAGSAAAAARGDWPEEVYIMNADGSGQRRLTRNPARDGGPVWSPDGRKIALTREWSNGRREIYVMNADGSGQRSLTPARSGSFSPAWSPDGRKIAFTAGNPPAPPDGIFVMNADGSEQRGLTQHGGGPAWSPDGQMIAFGSGATTAELHVMNADGNGKRKLTRHGWGTPFAWSPALPKRS